MDLGGLAPPASPMPRERSAAELKARKLSTGSSYGKVSSNFGMRNFRTENFHMKNFKRKNIQIREIPNQNPDQDGEM
jgi:hypothetical protein